MREFKFRAWDKVDSVFVYATLLPNGDFNIGKVDEADQWQQYTGLKDKNGKEIYEGDIVRDVDWGQRERARGQVFWQKDRFVIGKSPKHKTWWEFNAIMDETIEDDKEVIGNIYENKELLK